MFVRNLGTQYAEHDTQVFSWFPLTHDQNNEKFHLLKTTGILMQALLYKKPVDTQDIAKVRVTPPPPPIYLHSHTNIVALVIGRILLGNHTTFLYTSI
jgi:hypothetical protein